MPEKECPIEVAKYNPSQVTFKVGRISSAYCDSTGRMRTVCDWCISDEMRRFSRGSFIVKVSPCCLWAHLCSPQFGFRPTTRGLPVRLPRTVVLYTVCGMQVSGHRNRRPWRARREGGG